MFPLASTRNALPVVGVGVLAGMLTAAAGGLAFGGDDEAARVAAVVRPATDFSKAEPYELRSAGAATVFKRINSSIFSHPSANMPFDRQSEFLVGDGIFRKLWVSSPASTRSSDGLGPLFNARSCQGCHIKDGRGVVPVGDERGVSLFLRVSIPPQTEEQRAQLKSRRISVVPEPVYGTQLQGASVPGVKAEGRMALTYTPRRVTLGDGTVVELRVPSYAVTHLGYGPLHPDVLLSPRIAPPMIGMGLLEAVPEKDIRAGADPDDHDGNGISGRTNEVWDAAKGAPTLGRFGWKAGQPSVRQQSAGAFAGDIGISTPLFPDPHGDCTAAQSKCRSAPHGGDTKRNIPEAGPDLFERLVFYSRNLGVPARRKPGSPRVLAGKKLFYESGCIACHRPKFVTRRLPDRPEQSFQLIWPYTDLLLHDMGAGLADNRPEGAATGQEWRTPPLWGIGLTNAVNPRATFLHDGRARTLLEAILWHGGEAEAAKETVRQMKAEDREALIAFLMSL